MRARWPFGVVTVAGASMSPALLPGDLLLVRRGGRLRIGAVVVARRPGRPGLLVVKRVHGLVRPGWWWLSGDNPAASDDSRRFGPVSDEQMVATVLWRYWPPRRFSPGWRL